MIFCSLSNVHALYDIVMILFLVYYQLYVSRDIIGMEMVEIQANKKIGGVGMTVEVDESCFGHCKVKYNNSISLFVLFVLYFL